MRALERGIRCAGWIGIYGARVREGYTVRVAPKKGIYSF